MRYGKGVMSIFKAENPLGRYSGIRAGCLIGTDDRGFSLRVWWRTGDSYPYISRQCGLVESRGWP